MRQIFISVSGNRTDGVDKSHIVLTEESERIKNLGGYSSEVPPLPIPNREVKLTYADGTAVLPWESR